MKLPFHPSVAVLCGVLAMAGCNSQDQDQAAGAPAATAQNDDAARKLDTYRQLLRIHNAEMSVTMGHDILDRYPNSDAAKEVQQTLPGIERRWKEESEKRRLDALWQYMVSFLLGGLQSVSYTQQKLP